MPELARKQLTTGRVAAGLMILFAIVYGIAGSQIPYAFSSDPIGPRGFPIGLAIVLFALGVWYFSAPGQSEPWPDRKGIAAALFFLTLSSICVLAMDWIGFVSAIAILLGGASRLFGASWRFVFINGIGQALLWWTIFGPLLGGHLPKGPLGF